MPTAAVRQWQGDVKPSGSNNPYTGSRFRKALRFFVVGRAAQAVASLAMVLLAVRLMSPEDYGAYMVLLGIVELCRPLSSLGLLPAVQQFLPEMALHASPLQLRRFVRWASVLRFGSLILFGGGLYLLWQPASAWLGLHDAGHAQAWLVCLLVVTMLGAGFNDHMLEALLEQRYAQILRAAVPVGRLVGLLAAAAIGTVSLAVVLWIDIMVTGACLVAAEVVLARQLGKLRPDSSRHFIRSELVTFVWHMSGSQVLNAASSGGSLRLIVSNVLGVTAAGQFGFIQQIVLQLQRFLPSLLFANLVRPMLIATQVASDRTSVAAAAGLLWKSNSIFVLPLVALTLIGGDQLLAAMSGQPAAAGEPLAILVFGMVASAQTHITSMLMQINRLTVLVRNLSFMAVIAPAMVFAGAFYGLSWAAAGASGAVWVRNAMSSWFLARLQPALRPDFRGTVAAISTVLIALAFAWPLRGISIWLAMGVMVVLYLLGLSISRPLSAMDIDLMAKVLKGARMRPLVSAMRHFGPRAR